MKTIATILAIAAGSLSAAEPPAVLVREFIYEEAPFPSCHASTIAEVKAGLVAAWFGGTDEGRKDVGIWVSRRVDSKWSAPVEVADGIQPDGTRHPCWNPVLFQPKAGPLLLFYKVGPSPQTWWGMLRSSADAGATWSAATRLPDGILGPIKNKPIQLADGTILCPSSAETEAKPSAWRVHFELTQDLGKTWATAAPSSPGEPPLDAIQPSILALGGDRLLALGRTRQRAVFSVESADLGKTWGVMTKTVLPNPNAGTDAVALRDGRCAIVYNHTVFGRSPLNLSLSKDGRDWQAALVLENQLGEYSYPAIIQTADGLLHITYTWKRKKVRHVVIDPAKLETREMKDGLWPKAGD